MLPHAPSSGGDVPLQMQGGHINTLAGKSTTIYSPEMALVRYNVRTACVADHRLPYGLWTACVVLLESHRRTWLLLDSPSFRSSPYTRSSGGMTLSHQDPAVLTPTSRLSSLTGYSHRFLRGGTCA
jgi:hypothetical protein